MNFYKHHIGDYASATLHLTWDEDCAYRRLLDAYYRREAAIPADIKEACRLARAQTPGQRKAVEAVLREFFVSKEDGWHQKRCDAEIEEAEGQGGERTAKLENERERQRRHRDERKQLFSSLRDLDIVPAWDTKTETLRAMLNNATETRQSQSRKRDHVTPVTPPVTRTATANQTPDSRLQTKSKNPTGGAVHSEPATVPEPDRTAPAHVGMVLGRAEAFQRMRGAPVATIPPDWRPSETVRLRLTTAGCRQMAADDVARFVNHFAATAEMLADWDARAVNWMLDQRRFDQRNAQQSGKPDLTREERDAEFARLIAEDEARDEEMRLAAR